MTTLNKQVLANLKYELSLAIANHKSLRKMYLQNEIYKLEKLMANDNRLRDAAK